MDVDLYTAMPFKNSQPQEKDVLKNIVAVTGYDASQLQMFDLEEITDQYQITQNDNIVVIEQFNQQEQQITLNNIIKQFELLDNEVIINSLNEKCTSLETRLQILLNQLNQVLMSSKEQIQQIFNSIKIFQQNYKRPSSQDEQMVNKILKNEVVYIDKALQKKQQQIDQLIHQKKE